MKDGDRESVFLLSPWFFFLCKAEQGSIIKSVFLHDFKSYNIIRKSANQMKVCLCKNINRAKGTPKKPLSLSPLRGRKMMSNKNKSRIRQYGSFLLCSILCVVFLAVPVRAAGSYEDIDAAEVEELHHNG